MADLKVDNQTFNYPSAGTEAGWGQDATGWATEVTVALNSLNPVGTINETQITIENGQTRQILGLAFNQNITQSAEIEYRIFRSTDTTSLSEQGKISLIYNPGDVNKWFITREMGPGNDSLVHIDVDTSGQFNYTSTLIAGNNYTGLIRFKTYTTTQ